MVRLVVFAKPPRAGEAKTRLAGALGPAGAARLAGAMLQDTVAAARALGIEPVLSTPEPDADHGVDLARWDQGPGDLGARLARAAVRALAEADAFVAIGADSPGNPHLAALVDLARVSPAALGPADDGGFWGIGLRSCPDGLLDDLPWSRADTFDATAARLAPLGLALAPRWWDVDLPVDLERLRREVSAVEAPATFALLAP